MQVTYLKWYSTPAMTYRTCVLGKSGTGIFGNGGVMPIVAMLLLKAKIAYGSLKDGDIK